MKKIAIISIISFAMAFAFSACTSYDEGPGFTIIPAEKRIVGEWDQKEMYVNDELNEDIVFEFTFNSDGTGTSTITLGILGSSTDDIEWRLNDEKTKVEFKTTDADEWDDATILRLTTSEMWLVVDSGWLGIWEMHYEKV